MRGADCADCIQIWLVIEQHAAAAIYLKINKSGRKQSMPENVLDTVGGNGIFRDDFENASVLYQQHCVFVTLLAVKNRGSRIGNDLAHDFIFLFPTEAEFAFQACLVSKRRTARAAAPLTASASGD